MTTEPKTSGPKNHGRFVSVRSLMATGGSHSIIMACDGGNIHFQHNMTPTEARELAGYLQAEANYVEQATAKEIDWSAA